MVNLGKFKAGATIFYGANFHNDTGTIENPTSPEAQQRTPAGVWSSLTTPAIQNSKTGHYGGTVDSTGYAQGQYIIRMAGIVATAKTVATEFCFEIEAIDNADIHTAVGTVTAKLPTNYIMGSAVQTAKDDEIDAILEDTGTTLPSTLALEASLTDLKDEALGKWILNPVANTLTLYRQDGITVLKTFSLGTTTTLCPAYISRTPA